MDLLPIAPPIPGGAVEVVPGVWWLRMPLPFALDHVNLWLLRDGSDVSLVDCGYGDAVTRESAIVLLREAADMEDATEKHIVTPGHLLPAREMLGDLLLDLGRPAQALKEFEASAEKEQNRFRGLYGEARAAELSGNPTKARAYYTKLVSITDKADGTRPELRQAKAYLTRPVASR